MSRIRQRKPIGTLQPSRELLEAARLELRGIRRWKRAFAKRDSEYLFSKRQKIAHKSMSATERLSEAMRHFTYFREAKPGRMVGVVPVAVLDELRAAVS